MVKLLVLSFVINPMVNYLSNPKRRWNRYRKSAGHEIALLLLFLIALVNSLKFEKNYFQRLNGSPHSSVEFIKKSFKQGAMTVHPDRNTSPTASEDYVELVKMYKTLINDKTRELYLRYGDFIADRSDKMKDVTPVEVLYMVFLSSSTSFLGMFLFIMLYGKTMLNIPALVYELFCLALDVYLRFTPDARDFMSGVPVLHYYTIFEIIAFFRSFNLFFMYYSSIFQKQQDDVSWKVGAAILKNNVLAIDSLSKFEVQSKRLYTSLFQQAEVGMSGGSVQEGGHIEPSEGQSSSDNVSSHNISNTEQGDIRALFSQQEKQRTAWNRPFVQKLLRKADDAMGNTTSFVAWLLYLSPWLVSMMM